MDIEALKEQIKLTEFVQEYLPSIQRMGINLKCHCPFHSEKTPSFFLFENTQRYYCFGCKERGDLIDFVRNMEGVDTAGAIKFLCNKYGLQSNSNYVFDDSKIIIDVNNYYSEVFHQQFLDSKYFKQFLKQGWTEEIIEIFQVGYSSGKEIKTELIHTDFSTEDLQKAGLLTEKNAPVFVERIIFPILNSVNKVIGFGGRALKRDEKSKYINTKTNSVFNKSDVLYGLHTVQKKVDTVFLVEGYKDVIALFKENLPAMAIMGSAISRTHVNILKNKAKELILMFDSDSSGIKTTIDGIGKVKNSMKMRVASLPKDLDPYDLIFSHRKSIHPIIEDSQNPVDYMFSFLKGRNKDTIIEKGKMILEILADSVYQDVALQKISDVLRIPFYQVKAHLLSEEELTQKAKNYNRDAYILACFVASKEVFQLCFRRDSVYLVSNEGKRAWKLIKKYLEENPSVTALSVGDLLEIGVDSGLCEAVLNVYDKGLTEENLLSDFKFNMNKFRLQTKKANISAKESYSSEDLQSLNQINKELIQLEKNYRGLIANHY